MKYLKDLDGNDTIFPDIDYDRLWNEKNTMIDSITTVEFDKEELTSWNDVKS